MFIPMLRKSSKGIESDKAGLGIRQSVAPPFQAVAAIYAKFQKIERALVQPFSIQNPLKVGIAFFVFVRAKVKAALLSAPMGKLDPMAHFLKGRTEIRNSANGVHEQGACNAVQTHKPLHKRRNFIPAPDLCAMALLGRSGLRWRCEPLLH
jgi:hypothetical protein